MMSKYNDLSLTWFGDVKSISGTAQHSRELLKRLLSGGARIRVEHMPTQMTDESLDSWWKDTFKRCEQEPPGMVRINACPPQAGKQNVAGGPNVLFAYWETQAVPHTWIERINKYNMLIVPTPSLASPGATAGVSIPVKVSRYPLDIEKYSKFSARPKISDVDDSDFVIGFTGGWNNQTNVSDAIIAYLSMFDTTDRVKMVVKTYGKVPHDPGYKGKILKMVKEIKNAVDKPNTPPVVVVADALPQVSVDALIGRFDLLVSASRGEARNISMLKALAMGKTCITPGVLANADIHQLVSATGLSYSIPFSLEPVIQMQGMYSALDRWGRPDLCMTMDYMRKVHLDKLTGQIPRNARKAVCECLAECWDAEKVTDEFADLVRSIVPKVERITL